MNRIGPYEVLGVVGEGGMGRVYRARDERLGRMVAVKVLPEDLRDDAGRLRRFQREARAIGKLSHPNILVVHDVGEEDGAPYLVTELLEGETLRDRIKGGALAPAEAIDIAMQVARGLTVTHDAGIVHRDLKPSNLFVCEDGFVKILDFGIAKEQAVDGGTKTDTVATREGAAIGSVGYMAPEQIRGRPVDARTDIFAVGIVLFEMIAGARPFGGDTDVEVAISTLQEPQPALGDGKLDAVIARCLAKAPDDRYASVRDLAEDLEAVAASAPPPGAVKVTPARTLQRSSTSRVWIAAAAALALAGGGAGMWMLQDGNGATTRPAAISYVARALTATSPPNQVRWAAVSSDGARIAYNLNGRTAPTIQTTASDAPSWDLELPPGTTFALANDFFPDGRLMLSTIDGDGNLRMFAVDLDSGERERAFEQVGGKHLHSKLSPDGKTLAFHSRSAIRLADRNGERRPLLQMPGNQLPTHPSWSPDGRYLSFLRTRPGAPATLEILTVDGARNEVLTAAGDPEGDIIAAAWAGPERIVFARGVGRLGNDSNIYEIGVVDGSWDGHAPRRLHEVRGERVELLFPRGDRVFYMAHRGSSEVYVASAVEPGKPGVPGTLFSGHDGQHWSGPWTPDGRLTYGSYRAGGEDLYVQAPGGAAEPVAAGPDREVGLAVSGDAMLYWRVRESTCELYRVEPGGERRRLPYETEAPCPLVRCGSARPQRCAAIAVDEDDVTARRLDPVTGVVGDVVYRHDARSNDYFDLSPDGDRIVFAGGGDDAPGLFVGNLETGKTTFEQWDHPFIPHDAAWLPDGGGWIASGEIQGQQPPYVIMEHRPGGQPRLLRSLGSLPHNPSVSLDGKRMSFVTIRKEGNLTVLEPAASAALPQRNLRENRVTQLPDPVWTHAVSQDGKTLAYMQGPKTYVRPVAGGQPVPLPMPEDWIAAAPKDFFPDGHRLIVSFGREIGWGKRGLAVVDLRDGSAQIIREEEGIGIRGRLTRNGSLFAYSGPDGIRTILPTGEDNKLIIPLDDPAQVVAMSWSPSGTHLVTFRRGKTLKLVVTTADGSRSEVLPAGDLQQEEADSYGVEWFDDDRIVFGHQGSEGADSELWEIGMRDGAWDGEPPRRLFRFPVGTVDHFRRGGDRLFFVKNNANPDVFVAQLDEKGNLRDEPRAIEVFDADDNVTAITASGDVLFHSDRNGNVDLFRRSLTGAIAELIAGTEESEAFAVASGDAVLYLRRPIGARGDADVQRLYRVEPGSTQPKLLGEFDPAETPFASCAGDAPDRCVVSQFIGKDMVVRRFDPKTGAIGDEVYRRPRREVRDRMWLDARGRRGLVSLVNGQPAAAIVTLADGSARDVVFDGPAVGFANIDWLPNGGFVFAAFTPGVPFWLGIADETGKTRELWRTQNHLALTPRASHDGKRIVFTVNVLDLETWAIDGL